jgi:diguanylate cyclase (GGDEF)-like protein
MTHAPLPFPAELVHLGTESFLGSGAVLWQEGDPGGDVALILDGTLEVYRETSEGDVVLDVVEPGQAVGELAVDGGTRTACVRARTSCHVLRVGAAEYRQLLRQRPDILETLYWAQVNRLRRIVRHASALRPRRMLESQTRAYGYPFFAGRLEMELRRAEEAAETLALILVDIDDFAPYRGPHAPERGMQVLATLARLLRDRVTRADIVARYGETQLAVLLYGATSAAARDIAETFRTGALGQEFPPPPSGADAQITLSAAVAVFPADGHDPEALLRAADLRLYKARERGGNQVVAAS